jgi:hypothetical protein
MAEIGTHLLGRRPSPPDLRDYRLSNFEGLGEELALSPEEEIALAVKELQLTTITYKRWAATIYSDVTKTHWWQAFNHLVLAGGTPPPVPTLDKVWDVSFQLDQGNTGHCVGFGWAGWSNADPVVNQYDNQDGHDIYYETKVIEGDPGAENGAYPRDGAKAMLARKRLSAYAMADSVDTILTHLRSKGTVGIGTDWTSDMFDPDANGFVKPTGSVQGGHWYLLYGVQGDTLLFKNSWGDDWGDNGSFRMTKSDFQVLFQAWGEAIASVELPL